MKYWMYLELFLIALFFIVAVAHFACILNGPTADFMISPKLLWYVTVAFLGNSILMFIVLVIQSLK